MTRVVDSRRGEGGGDIHKICEKMKDWLENVPAIPTKKGTTTTIVRCALKVVPRRASHDMHGTCILSE